MHYLKMDIEKILRYMIKRLDTKDEAVGKITNCLIGQNDLATEFKHNFRFSRDFLWFKQRLEKHIDLLIDFRRTIESTIEYFIEAAAEVEKDLTGTQKYYKIMEEKAEAENRIREKQEENRRASTR